MELKLFKPLWGHVGSLADAVAQAIGAGFDGIEASAPEDACERLEFADRLKESGLAFIAEVFTAGGYVPRREASRSDHLDCLRMGVERALEMRPLFITTIAGCDAWPLKQQLAFFEEALELGEQYGVPISVETHRSRSTFTPWITAELLRELPGLKLTCDFSHWCVVCERLPDTEPDIMTLCFERAHHVHARVGDAQGPQVPDPSAPEYAHELQSHERWWSEIWSRQQARGFTTSTMTPEFGPDGYLHHAPHSNLPVADLWQINCWMAARQRQRFANRKQS